MNTDTMSSDPTQRFSDRVADYVRYRPNYPDAVYAALQLQSSDVVADVGSGTGLSTDLFLRHGHRVFGIEPNEAMRKAAEEINRDQPLFTSVAGSAEATTLPKESVDLVVAAQAFHWFDVPKAKVEFRRILRANGRVALIWNSRRTDSTPFLRAYEQFLIEFGTDYTKVNHQNLDRRLLDEMFTGPYESRVFDNRQVFDWDGVQGRLRSSSYVPAPGTPEFGPMIERLRVIFDQYQECGRVTFEYDTELFVGRVH